MEQIVYVSTAKVMPDQAMIESILSVSRENNRRDQLTGLLVTGGRRFLQVLEGPTDQLEAAYARIRVDSRHFALVQLSRRPILTRSFDQWDMGFEQGYAAPLTEVVAQLTERVADPDLKAQFRSFAELHGQPA
ncbi:hypothetical protein GCM10022281_22820 [Sphingomonas rosea]|jgi:hypothetical protein|uniref:BLUF domain-containing protein n=1 Tax=Sphingomonas rosea TaxID=335605 RepID=A0ABP7UDZ6_9SPHN